MHLILVPIFQIKKLQSMTTAKPKKSTEVESSSITKTSTSTTRVLKSGTKIVIAKPEDVQKELFTSSDEVRTLLFPL